MLTIWIDGDACPRPIKDLTFRAATRTKTDLIIVSNHFLAIPPSPFLKAIQVGSGFDMVDRYIVDHLQPGDLIITADLPFADAVVTGGARALNPRGMLYTANNIKQMLGHRNINETMRSGGLISGGPSAITAKDIQRYANQLDHILQKGNLF